MIPNLSLFLTPIILSPLVLGDNVSNESKCAFVVLYVATLWALNPIPLPITSLFPVVLLPVLSLGSTETACGAYLKGNNMLFLGCLTIALAVEKSNLHQRVALKVLLSVSTKFKWILLGFMLTTAWFSMWIVSTATVAMMLPIADEVLNNLFSSFDVLNDNHHVSQDGDRVVVLDKDKEEQQQYNSMRIIPGHNTEHSVVQHQHQHQQMNDKENGFIHLNNGLNGNKFVQLGIQQYKTDDTNDDGLLSKEHRSKVQKMFYLMIAYSSTVGAVSTLTANGPNMVMKDVLEEHYETRDPVDYASWLIFAMPISLVLLLIFWLVYNLLYFRHVTIPDNRKELLERTIAKKYKQLGPLTFHEIAVLLVFVFMIILYIMYKPQFFNGWFTWFDDPKMAPRMASAAILCVMLLFVIPAKPNDGLNMDLKKDALLDWHTIQTKLEWGVIFIRGGGFALADAVNSSGLSALVGTQLSQLSTVMSTTALTVSLSVVANSLIEFMRTSATAAVVIPVTINLAESLHINPLKLVIPMATSCAYAFITPVGTTVNTLTYFHGKLTLTEMILPGLIAKALTMIVMLAYIALFGNLVFDIDNTHPEWLYQSNETSSTETIYYMSSSGINYTTTPYNIEFNTTTH